MTKEEAKAFVESIRGCNLEAIQANATRVEKWKLDFPGKPIPWYLKSFNPNRYEPFLKKIEREHNL